MLKMSYGLFLVKKTFHILFLMVLNIPWAISILSRGLLICFYKP